MNNSVWLTIKGLRLGVKAFGLRVHGLEFRVDGFRV
jgi:hypothetical protein